MREIHKRYYVPNYSALVVTGDVNPEDIAKINEARIGQEDPLEETSRSRLALPNPQEA